MLFCCRYIEDQERGRGPSGAEEASAEMERTEGARTEMAQVEGARK